MQEILQQFLQRDATPLVQFFKYAIAGGFATGVDMLVFFFFAWRVLPALRENDPLATRLHLKVRHVEEDDRSRRFILCTLIAFMFSNLTAYLINIHWVFQPGRHAWYVELALFYAVSGISIFIGTTLGWAMIRYMHLSTSFSYIGKMFASLMINFVCRKYFVFNG
ncbi:MAG TPA: GtrA family protein [Kiritimatiellia bacterium]|nr:GtrA family protein [Kiritimatiellia bacterium]